MTICTHHANSKQRWLTRRSTDASINGPRKCCFQVCHMALYSRSLQNVKTVASRTYIIRQFVESMTWVQPDYPKKRSEEENPMKQDSWPEAGAMHVKHFWDPHTARTCTLTLLLQRWTPLYLVPCATYARPADNSVNVGTQTNTRVCRKGHRVLYWQLEINVYLFFQLVLQTSIIKGNAFLHLFGCLTNNPLEPTLPKLKAVLGASYNLQEDTTVPRIEGFVNKSKHFTLNIIMISPYSTRTKTIQRQSPASS